jgi:hypothetical protein
MTALQVLAGGLDDERRGELVLAGDLLVFKDVAPLRALSALTEGLITEILEGGGSAAGRNDAPAAIEALQQRFRADGQARRLFRSALESVGVDVERTYWDRLYLRVQVPSATGAGSLGCHRDTWSSNIYEQVNWWTPIRPITAERTIAFYPAYWTRPIENSSARWDLEAIRARRATGEDLDVPIVPEPTEPVDVSSELRIVIEPGDLLCFSGAHLHASVPNTSSEARFSIEVRSVNADDLRSGRGAPNLDGHAPRVPFEWFERITDRSPLVHGA